MATLLHHVKPWMQRSIAKSEIRMKRKIETMMDQKVQAVHKRLDAFELRVLERPAPATNLSSFRTELDNLLADLESHFDTIEDARAKKQERQQNKQARRASIVDEELHQQRVRESTLGASISRPTTESTVRDDVSTTDGAWDLGNRTTRLLMSLRRYAPQVCFTQSFNIYFFCIGDNCTLFCLGWGKWIVSDRVKSE
uniref:Integrase core domain containing protein n=1 Tax=Solanum tuberosum TaxID=4113 RepID=M1DKX4_SOLTU